MWLIPNLSLCKGYWSIGLCTMGVVITWFNITWYPIAVIWAEYRSEIRHHNRLSMISYEVASAMIWENIDRAIPVLHCFCFGAVNFVYEQRRKGRYCLQVVNITFYAMTCFKDVCLLFIWFLQTEIAQVADVIPHWRKKTFIFCWCLAMQELR